ncbi:MAG: hypothetical protein U0232_27595 [Thermomicrobiales bacterium]
MVKSKPFTLRLSEGTDAWVEHESRRTKRSKGAVVEALTEEAVRMRRFPGIAFRGPEHDRRAWVIGTAFDVWEIVSGYRDSGSLERLLAASHLKERPARLALRYAEAYPDEIEQALKANELTPDQAAFLYPTLFTER